MNINFELYRIFYTVANQGNITKASEILNISQPAISKAIKNLEQQLGGSLFVRTKRGVILTEEGKEFYRYIKQAMENINNAEHKFSELIHLETGTIRIGISTTLTKSFLLSYLESFHQAYPKIKIQTVSAISSELIPKLRNGLVDLVVLNMNQSLQYNDIEIIPCKEVHDGFIANQEFSFLKGKTISLKELNQYPLILQSSESNTRAFLDQFARDHGVTLKPSVELGGYSLVVEFTKIGFGIGYATRDFINPSDLEKIFFLSLKEKIPSRYIGIALSKNNVPSFSTQKLIEFIR